MSLEAHVYNVSRFFLLLQQVLLCCPLYLKQPAMVASIRIYGWLDIPRVPYLDTRRKTQQRIRPYLFCCFSSPPVEIIRILMSLFSVFTRHYIETKKGRVRRVLKTGSLRWVVFIGLPRDRQAGGHSR